MGDTGPDTGPGNTSRFGGCFQLGFMIMSVLFLMVAIAIVIVAGGGIEGIQGWLSGQQNQAEQGPGEGNQPGNQGNQAPNQGNTNPQANAPDVIPHVADADWASGTTELVASGFFTVDATIGIDAAPSLTMEDATYLQFGTSGGSGANLLIHVIDGTAGITLAQGSRTASATDEDCSVQVQVSGGTVSGSVACANIAAYDTATGDVGVTSFHLTFSAQ